MIYRPVILLTHILAVLEPETNVNFDYTGQWALYGTSICLLIPPPFVQIVGGFGEIR